jgi:hypothetical protein
MAQFPSIAISDKQKDADYHKSWVEAIVGTSFGPSRLRNHTKLKLLYEFFLEGNGSDITSYLQTGPDGSAMPGIWMSIATVKSKLRVLVGELLERGYLIKARALNAEAQSRKFEERERLRIKRKLQEIRLAAEEMSGMQLEQPEMVPQSDEELDEYMNISWKDKHVRILEAAIKWIAQRNEWDEHRTKLFLDVLIANIVATKTEVIRGVPRTRRIDPLKFIYDENSTDDMLSDSTYFGEVEYLPLASAAERYGLTLKEMEECYKTYQQYMSMSTEARSTHADNSAWSSSVSNGVHWFTVENGVPRCLVVQACWRDYKHLAHKSESNEKGEFLQDISKDDKEQTRKRNEGKIILNKIECWRQGVIIAGKYLREWGECPNQPRELDTLELTEPPYKVWIPEFYLGKFTSLLEQQVGPSLLKDIAAYKLQIEMAKAVGKVIVLDAAFFQEGSGPEQVIGRMKAEGVIIVNSKEYQMGQGNINLFQEFDLGLSQSIAQNIQIIQWCDQVLDSMSGVSQERQGVVQGSSQAVGVTQAALFQSNLITAPYFKGFSRYESRLFNLQAKMVKVVWGEKGGSRNFAPIIGDSGVDFLEANVDISLDSFDVIVQSLPPSTLERGKLEEMLMIAVQSDPEFIDDALDILIEPDTTVAITRFKRRRAIRKKILALQEQAMQEEQAAMQQEQMAMQQGMSQEQAQLQLMIQQMKEQGKLKNTLAGSRTKLQQERIKLLGR